MEFLLLQNPHEAWYPRKHVIYPAARPTVAPDRFSVHLNVQIIVSIALNRR
jgi:hypothetical protein